MDPQPSGAARTPAQRVKRYSGDKQSGAWNKNSGDSWHVGCDVIYGSTLTGPELGRRLDAVAVERRNINYNTGGYEVTIKKEAAMVAKERLRVRT